MATQARAATLFDREYRFFFITACLMALVLVAGFSANLLLGRSTFAVPPIFHLHAFVFFGWVVLYLAQTGLVATGSLALHRRLGWLALGWVPVMLILGIAILLTILRTTGGPFFFAKNEFLFGNLTGLATFAGTVFWAIGLRRRTDWHRRLMLGAMAGLTGPGFGRLLPVPLMMPWAWWISAVLFPALFIVAGMIADRRRLGRVHPAYWWGLGLLAGGQLVAQAIAYSPVGYAVTDAVTAGTPGAARPMQAQWPSRP
jgi:hypothetical protein